MESRYLRYLIPAVLAKAWGVSHLWRDLYHLFLTISWPRFLVLIVLLYIAVNALFALAYLAGGNCLENARPGSFLDAFFFSVDTIATVGYGSVYPRTLYANTIVTMEVLIGLLGFAIVTGLMFAKFSRPTARVLFSRVAVVAPFNGMTTLMFRAANERRNQILEAQMQMNLVRNEVTAEGQPIRRFYDLKLVRNRTPIFSLTWTVMHIIDETSPLYEATKDSLAKEEAEIVVTLTGLDETVSQIIHTRHSFTIEEILWNMRFVDILSRTSDGRVLINYDRFHDVIPL
jgi:inward rectifier potassium channel